MKKIISVLLVISVVFLCACKSEKVEETTASGVEETTEMPVEITTVESLTVEELEPANVITVYFSHNDPVAGVAEYIKEKTECGIHKIETLKEYPDDEADLIKTAAEEHSQNARPALKNAPESMGDYDIVFLCFPIWDGTMPMALFTFLEDYDMRDKIVVPVVYGNKADLDTAIRDINSLFSTMLIVNGFCIGDDFLSQQTEFETWFNTVLYG